MNENTFAELAAGHALNALSAPDRVAFESALLAHPEWAVHLRTQTDAAALLSEPIGSVVPPAAVRESLLARIATTPQSTDAADPDAADPDAAEPEEDFAAAGPAPVAPTAAVAPAPLRRRWFTLAASIVIVLALGFGAVVVGQQLTRPAAVVALEQIEDAPDAASATVELSDGGEATAHWSASLGEVVFVSDGLPALAADKTFELWFVREEGAVSAGTFEPGGDTATALLEGTYEPGDTIAVTVEPAGGSPTGSPTSDPILAITTA